MGARKQTPHELAEAALTAHGLTFPEATAAPGWVPTRALYMRKKMFAVFGARDEAPGALTITTKLPVSAEMVQNLYYVQETSGWYRRHNWVIARFGPEDDILSELDTLKGWLAQSYCAIAPKKLAVQVRAS